MNSLGPIPKESLVPKGVRSSFPEISSEYPSGIIGTCVIRLVPYAKPLCSHALFPSDSLYPSLETDTLASRISSPDGDADTPLDSSLDDPKNASFSSSPVRRFFTPSAQATRTRHIETIEAAVSNIYKSVHAWVGFKKIDPSFVYKDRLEASLSKIRDELLTPSYSLTEEDLEECEGLNFETRYLFDLGEGTPKQQLAIRHAKLLHQVNKSLREAALMRM